MIADLRSRIRATGQGGLGFLQHAVPVLPLAGLVDLRQVALEGPRLRQAPGAGVAPRLLIVVRRLLRLSQSEILATLSSRHGQRHGFPVGEWSTHLR